MNVNTILSKLRNTALLLIITSISVVQGAALYLTEATEITERIQANTALRQAEAELMQADSALRQAEAEAELMQSNTIFRPANIIFHQTFTEYEKSESNLNQAQIKVSLYIVNDIMIEETQNAYGPDYVATELKQIIAYYLLGEPDQPTT